MTVAIFGLVGVIVGAVVTGATSLALERRREKVEARTAARVAYSALFQERGWIDSCLEVGSWQRSDSFGLEAADTSSARTVLASALSDKHEWEVVENAFLQRQRGQAVIAMLEGLAAEGPIAPGTEAEAREQLGPVVDDITEGVELLLSRL